MMWRLATITAATLVLLAPPAPASTDRLTFTEARAAATVGYTLLAKSMDGALRVGHCARRTRHSVRCRVRVAGRRQLATIRALVWETSTAFYVRSERIAMTDRQLGHTNVRSGGAAKPENPQ